MAEPLRGGRQPVLLFCKQAFTGGKKNQQEKGDVAVNQMFSFPSGKHFLFLEEKLFLFYSLVFYYRKKGSLLIITFLSPFVFKYAF